MPTLIRSFTAAETCLVPPVCADINNNLSKHLPYKCWGKGKDICSRWKYNRGLCPCWLQVI